MSKRDLSQESMDKILGEMRRDLPQTRLGEAVYTNLQRILEDLREEKSHYHKCTQCNSKLITRIP